jgi:hypothetical protein
MTLPKLYPAQPGRKTASKMLFDMRATDEPAEPPAHLAGPEVDIWRQVVAERHLTHPVQLKELELLLGDLAKIRRRSDAAKARKAGDEYTRTVRDYRRLLQQIDRL